MGTSAEDSKHYLLAISSLNKAVSDTEKFGALFVVTNVLKDKPLSCEQNQHLFKSIDPNFLHFSWVRKPVLDSLLVQYMI